MSNKPETTPGAPKREGSPNRAVLRPAGGPISYVPLKRKRGKDHPSTGLRDHPSTGEGMPLPYGDDPSTGPSRREDQADTDMEDEPS